MNYPEEAKVSALAAGFTALVKALHESGALPAEAFLGNVAGAADTLARTEQELAAHALKDLVDPLALLMGYRGEIG